MVESAKPLDRCVGRGGGLSEAGDAGRRLAGVTVSGWGGAGIVRLATGAHRIRAVQGSQITVVPPQGLDFEA